MEQLIRGWDGEYVVTRYDAAADAWIFIAIHSTRLGPGSGGTRMRVYRAPVEGLDDAQRLARGMTLKWAGVDFPRGGAKGVIALSKLVDDSQRESLLERYGLIVESLRGGFSTGPDLGVGPDLVGVIARQTQYVSGIRGAGDPGPWTALGVVASMEAAAAEALGRDDLSGLSIVVQGIGDVGLPLCGLLSERGARLVVADVDEMRVRRVAEELGAEAVDPGPAHETPCDIFAPCAVGGTLNSTTIPRLQCKVVAGSANNQLQRPADADALHERGILYAPDFINNSGGAVYIVGTEALGWSEEKVREKILGIGGVLGEIFREARANDEAPVLAAERLARRVLDRGPGT